MSSERITYTQWIKRGNNKFYPSDNSKTTPKIDAGVYSIEEDPQIGMYVVKKDLKLDEIFELPSPDIEDVIKGAATFFKSRERYKKNGFTHKRGYLLYGAPGNGKSSIINLICASNIKERNGVCFTITTYSELDRYKRFIQTVYRYIEPETPIITIIEDIDGICESSAAETLLINVLDGIEQTDNILYVATTNFPEKLSQRLVNRPNRFDRKVEIKPPTENSRVFYLKEKLLPYNCPEDAIIDIAKKTEGFSMAQLQEVVKSFILLELDLDTAIKEVANLSKITNSSTFSGKEKIGFGNHIPERETGRGYIFSNGIIIPTEQVTTN